MDSKNDTLCWCSLQYLCWHSIWMDLSLRKPCKMTSGPSKGSYTLVAVWSSPFYFSMQNLERTILKQNPKRHTMGQDCPKCKETPLVLSILIFLVWMYPYGSFGVPLIPKSHDTLAELFRFTGYMERNKVHFAPYLRFHWNHYMTLSDVCSTDWTKKDSAFLSSVAFYSIANFVASWLQWL